MKIKLPKRPVGGNKGTFGTVAILGGNISKNQVMLGGPAFSAEAALRSGAGLVVFTGSQAVITELINLVPQAVGIASDNDYSKYAKKWTAIIIGPGLGINKANINIINKLLSLKLPTVIDADGLNTIAENPQIAENIHADCVLTPHLKEFERLASVFMVKNADEMARKLECTVALKGGTTYVTNGRQSWSNKAENPALATGGTGDVLSGIIGGLMAQSSNRLSVYDCACIGVQIHSRAGELWKERHGSGGLIISELLTLVPEAMDEMRKT